MTETFRGDPHNFFPEKMEIKNNNVDIFNQKIKRAGDVR